MKSVIVIPVYLSTKSMRYEFLRSTIKALAKSITEISGDHFCQAVIVDDNSDIGPQHDIQFSECDNKICYLYSNKRIKNFARSVNLGIEYMVTGKKPDWIESVAGVPNLNYIPDVVGTINDDVECTAGDIDTIVKDCLLHPNMGAASPVMLYSDGRIQSMGSVLLDRPDGMRVDLANRGICHKWINPEANSYIPAPAVSGGFLFTPYPIWKLLEGFDERFIMGFEDVDYCFRAIMQGLEVLINTGVKVIHHEGLTRNIGEYESGNIAYLHRKWCGRLQDLSGRVHDSRERYGYEMP